MKRSGGYGKRTEFTIPLQRLEKLADDGSVEQ
jgi:hypothetical protein